ncbi:hypothetical protein CRUP_010477, partial [Coryphaenoides rupestris]
PPPAPPTPNTHPSVSKCLRGKRTSNARGGEGRRGGEEALARSGPGAPEPRSPPPRWKGLTEAVMDDSSQSCVSSGSRGGTPLRQTRHCCPATARPPSRRAPLSGHGGGEHGSPGAPVLMGVCTSLVGIVGSSEEDQRLYQALGLRKSLKDVLNFSNMLRYAEYPLAGMDFPKPLPSIQDDMFQLGGDFVVDERGEVVFSHCCQSPLDRPTVTDLLAGL